MAKRQSEDMRCIKGIRRRVDKAIEALALRGALWAEVDTECYLARRHLYEAQVAMDRAVGTQEVRERRGETRADDLPF